MLGFEDAVETFERKGAAAIEEVRDVRLAEAGELSESSAREGAGLDTAEEFEAKQLMKIGEVHR